MAFIGMVSVTSRPSRCTTIGTSPAGAALIASCSSFHVVTGVPEHQIIMSLLEGLVSEDPHGVTPQPGTAERWELSPDQTPDGRPGVSLLMFAFSRDALQKAAINRVGADKPDKRITR